MECFHIVEIGTVYEDREMWRDNMNSVGINCSWLHFTFFLLPHVLNLFGLLMSILFLRFAVHYLHQRGIYVCTASKQNTEIDMTKRLLIITYLTHVQTI